VIYNPLQDLDDRLATVKLVAGKVTLVAPRLWPELIAIGTAREPWHLDRLADDALRLLHRVDTASDPVLLDHPEVRQAGKRLEARLLVATQEIHTDSGRAHYGFRCRHRSGPRGDLSELV
jgi:hypothetical protein